MHAIVEEFDGPKINQSFVTVTSHELEQRVVTFDPKVALATLLRRKLISKRVCCVFCSK